MSSGYREFVCSAAGFLESQHQQYEICLVGINLPLSCRVLQIKNFRILLYLSLTKQISGVVRTNLFHMHLAHKLPPYLEIADPIMLMNYWTNI